eukprot:scaffold28448_cov30-Tisochrysis_lutea.AAC.1
MDDFLRASSPAAVSSSSALALVAFHTSCLALFACLLSLATSARKKLSRRSCSVSPSQQPLSTLTKILHTISVSLADHLPSLQCLPPVFASFSYTPARTPTPASRAAPLRVRAGTGSDGEARAELGDRECLPAAI